jgi:hypothetical protein
MTQAPCTILRDVISIYPKGLETTDSPLIDILGHNDIKCANPQAVYAEESLAGAEIIARTLLGNACGFETKLGNGTLIHLGTWLGFDTEGHKPVYEALLKRSGAVLRQAWGTNENITVRERFTDSGPAVLFIGNYYNEEQMGKVFYKHPETGDDISVPYSGETIAWPALYGVLSPICMELEEGLMILHTTSDILEIKKLAQKVEITLFGDRDLAGEIVLEGRNAAKIKSATVDELELQLARDGERMIFCYRHKHHQEMTLTVFMD